MKQANHLDKHFIDDWGKTVFAKSVDRPKIWGLRT
jgi:hypothetical protein